MEVSVRVRFQIDSPPHVVCTQTINRIIVNRIAKQLNNTDVNMAIVARIFFLLKRKTILIMKIK